MGLRDIVIPTKAVRVADQEFTVRGLSPLDAFGLYQRHAGELSALFEQFRSQAEAGAITDPAAFGAELLSGAPQIMAEIVASASDCDPQGEDWPVVMATTLRLPASVQLDALQKVADLTFTSEMPAPKFLGLVLQMAKSAAAGIENANPSSLSKLGSGESGAK